MIKLPKDLQASIDFLSRLPGIGPKTAKRLGFFLLRLPERDLQEVATHLQNLKNNKQYCAICGFLTENTRCEICSDSERREDLLLVVEEILDVLSFESGDKFVGRYQVLGGRIDPMNYIGPEDLAIEKLRQRLAKNTNIKEIIIATNANTEGEATAMYLKKLLSQEFPSLKITRLAYGMPIGGQVEYADYLTLQRAMEGRREME